MSRSIKTFRGLRTSIGIFGRRNAGKSSLLNAFCKQRASIVSAEAGTTTDPVRRPMELLPLGPVVFIDTAGLDDEGALGEERVKKSRGILGTVDIGIIACESGCWSDFEQALARELKKRGAATLVAWTKADKKKAPSVEDLESLKRAGIPWVFTSVASSLGLAELRELIIQVAPEEKRVTPHVISDLVGAEELAILVVPIDKEAPKGRLIAPQVQTLRELLDNDAIGLVVKEHQLRSTLALLREPPKIVVTDSQAFKQVAADVPPSVPMTSFSILFARAKGDLETFVEGAAAIDTLEPGSRVLIAEACTHHAVEDDIGRVKIPRWLREHVGGELAVDHCQGPDFPDDLSVYDLIIHCGACMLGRRAVLSRIETAKEQRVPITNYGIAIAKFTGIQERALAPFFESAPRAEKVEAKKGAA